MKKLMVALTLVGTLSVVHAADLLEGLFSSQVEIKSDSPVVVSPGGSPLSNTPAVVPNATSKSDSTNCLSKDQTSLPLRYVLGLLRTKGKGLSVTHNPASGQLKIKGGSYASNCAGMVEWQLKAPTDGFPQYVVEAKIKTCGTEKCSYKVTKKDEKGDIVEYELKDVAPNYSGFEQCLKETEVFTDKGVDASKMITRDLDVTLDGAFSSGPVWFGSHGPLASAVFEKTGENGCYYFEDIKKNGLVLSSERERQKALLDEEAQQVCDTKNYKAIGQFIDRYQQYASSLGKIRNELILAEVEKIAKALKANESLDGLDLSVIASFQEEVIDPIISEINRTYTEFSKLPSGPEKTAKQAKIKELIAKLTTYRKTPYLTEASREALIAKGDFDSAETLNNYLLAVSNYQQIGVEDRGVITTPKVAQQRIARSKADYKQTLAAKQKEYDIKNGRVVGKSQAYFSGAKQYQANVKKRTESYTIAIQEELAKVQQGGECTKLFTQQNQQRCVQEVQENVVALKARLVKLNTADQKTADELLAAGNKYAAWEKEGQRVLASQNKDDDEDPRDGDEVVIEPAGPINAPATTTTQQNGNQNYQFQFNAPQQGQQQCDPRQPPGYNPNAAQPPGYCGNGYPQQGQYNQQQQPWFGQQQGSIYGGQQYGQQYGQNQFQFQGPQMGAQFGLQFGLGGQQMFGQQQYGQQFLGQPQYGQQYGQQYGGNQPYQFSFNGGQQQQPYPYGQQGYNQYGMQQYQPSYMNPQYTTGLNYGFR